MKRTIFALLLAGLSLTACGGGGGSGSSGGALPGTTATQPVVPASATTAPDGSLQGTGPVAAIIAGGFTLNTGTSHGLVHVYTNSSTVFTGLPPFVGENVQVTGTGSWSTSVTATTVSQMNAVTTVSSAAPAPTPTPTVITAPAGVVSSQGNVAGPRTGGITLDQGLPNGKIPVTIPSTATIVGSTPATGQYVQITGTGSVHTGMTATVVTTYSSAPGSVTAQGMVASSTSYGFTLNVDAAHPAVPVILGPGAVIAGGTLTVGSQVTVTGPGSISASITPVQVVVAAPTPPPAAVATPTPGPISMTHVMTADYLGGYYGTHSIAWSAAAPYLNWASTNQVDANAISAAGIKTMYYTNPNRTQSNDPMYTTDETTFAHDCNGNRITDVFGTTTQYVMNVNSSSLYSLYQSKVLASTSGAHFDAVFEDDAGTLSSYGFTTLPCNYTDSQWLTGNAALNAAAPFPVIFNGLSSLNGHGVSQSTQLLSAANTIGGNFEHCYSDDTAPKQTSWMWVATENTELQTAAAHKTFECQLRDTSAAASNTDPRLYAMASFLLTYDPSTSVIWEGFATTSGFHVMPENQLVVENPVQATPGDISGLQTSSGVYGRQYQDCYIAGNFVGPCAIAVNPDPNAQHAFPYPQYTHSLVISGSGIMDGGTVSTSGPAAPMYLPPLGSAIVFP